ncbi:hypothetical protein B9Z55_015105 [Caenorhabditis nigoni]|uniref:SUN domain-containing protein n=1 Tax=Caenorhabditis nigoni TaxID=1611254 RepID=A0A2G5U8N7_9PELO|nr:hypothetical protein B9Z55_015105 [Caenorhabditis nigoni]
MLPTTHSRNPNRGSDANFIRNNTFGVEEPNTKTTIWYKWISNRIRQYMIPEIFHFICLVLILYRLQTLSNQNDRVLETVNSMQSKFGKMERKIETLVSRKPNQGINAFDNTEPLEQSIADVLESMKSPVQDSTEKMGPIIPQTKQSTSKTAESTFEVSIPKELYRFNAADYLKGASVDNDYSSSSNLNPIIGYDQTNLVLLDRPQPPKRQAWCTTDKNPVLTINLAKYIKPISVSYQHSKWNGAIPNGAPRTYDVVACLDFYCEKWKPLASNCQYSRYESKGTEQICNISSHLDVPLIGKVQFRFRENYGDTKTTCVHLVRVYGETKSPLKTEEKKLRSEELCTDLRWYYHNNFFKYTWVNSMQSKFGNMERKIELLVSRKPNQDMNPFDNTEPLEQSIADVLKNMKSPTHDSTEKMEPIVPQTKQFTSKTAAGSTFEVSFPKEPYRFNAADYLKGASVDNDHSSSSSLNPLIGYDQTNLVLLDRPQPPADKAWCTNDENPVLTINLAKYIKPISVSYQHSKWNGAIPNGAPKIYDVVACLDFYCEKWKPLALNCQYSPFESNEKEQMCNVTSHLDDPLIGKVQFRFRENYGDTKMTCVHLVRVHGEAETPVKIEEKLLKSEELCTDLRWYYHNSYFKYTWTDKNCTVLYKNNCCSECPECCEECSITDYNGTALGNIVGNTILGILIGILSLMFLFLALAALVGCIACCTGNCDVTEEPRSGRRHRAKKRAPYNF